VTTERAVRRKKLIQFGDLKRIREYAIDGRSQGFVARALGMSPPTFRRCLREDPRVAEAWDDGRDEREIALVSRIHAPWTFVPDKLSVEQWKAAVRAIQHGALVELNSKFGWRQDQAPDAAKLSVEIKLPGPMSPAQYKAALEGQATRVDDDA
jgi:hypothetical protein